MRCNHAAACKVFFAKLISAEFWNVQIYGQWVFNSNPKRMAKSMHPTHGRLIALPLILITWDGLTLSRSSRGVPARSAWWSVVGMQWELNISKGVRNLSKACAERTAESQWLTGHVHAFAGAFCGLLTFKSKKNTWAQGCNIPTTKWTRKPNKPKNRNDRRGIQEHSDQAYWEKTLATDLPDWFICAGWYGSICAKSHYPVVCWRLMLIMVCSSRSKIAKWQHDTSKIKQEYVAKKESHPINPRFL